MQNGHFEKDGTMQVDWTTFHDNSQKYTNSEWGK